MILLMIFIMILILILIYQRHSIKTIICYHYFPYDNSFVFNIILMDIIINMINITSLPSINGVIVFHFGLSFSSSLQVFCYNEHVFFKSCFFLPFPHVSS